MIRAVGPLPLRPVRGPFESLAVRWLVLASVLLALAPHARANSTYRFTDVARVVAFADVHGAYDELVSLLRQTEVVDDSLRWNGGATHMVSLGDLVDRGPDSRRVLDLLMRLEREARDAGGAVHMVLGNHEVMNLAGDLRYVSEAEYAAFAGAEDEALREAAWQRVVARDPAASRAAFDEAHPRGYFAHRQAFSPAGRYGSWLLARPFVLVVNGTAFAHGGLPPMVASRGLDAANGELHEDLARYLRSWEDIESGHVFDQPVHFHDRPAVVAGLLAPDQAQAFAALQAAEVFTVDGPTWFRGQALCNPHVEEENLEAALAAIGASRVVTGHTVSPTGRVIERFDGRVVLLDTGMLRPVYGGTASALLVEDGALSVVYADQPGARSRPEPVPRAVGPRPRHLDDDALERWLAEAEVVSVEDLESGITDPQRVTLAKDGIELRAVFKHVSTDLGGPPGARRFDSADQFEYEIAAYRLDRLLGLGMVPVAVPRTIGKTRGVLEFWVEDSVTLRRMLETGLRPDGWCPVEPQYNLMNVFDVLIYNTDRTQENALFTRDWMLVLIDHSRAFRTRRGAPRLLYKEPPQITPSLARSLSGLDEQQLVQALGGVLERRQINAILKRRDQLLRGYRESTVTDGVAAR